MQKGQKLRHNECMRGKYLPIGVGGKTIFWGEWYGFRTYICPPSKCIYSCTHSVTFDEEDILSYCL
jgi:hypothetical protein